MSYRLRYDRNFMRKLEALPGDLRSVARQTITTLTKNPRPASAKELENHPDHYHLWLPRNCRLVYQVSDDEQIVDLLYVGPKLPDLYDQLGLGR